MNPSDTAEIVVIGAGPAGLAAALAASSQRGAHGAAPRILVIDDNARAGGQIWRHGPGFAAPRALLDLTRALQRCPGVRVLQQVRVAALPAPGSLLLEAADGHAFQVRYHQLILATGAREKLLPFTGWTLPGVTGAGGLQALIKGGVAVRGERVVVAGSGPLLFAAAATAQKAGARVIAIVESAATRSVARFIIGLAATPSKLVQAVALRATLRQTHYLTGSMVLAAQGVSQVDSVTVRTPKGDRVIACERLACGYGLLPQLSLARSLGCATGNRNQTGAAAILVDQLQHTSVAGIYAAGECTGIGGMELARAQGTVAGYAAAGAVHAALRAGPARDRWCDFAASVERAFVLTALTRVPPAPQTLLCRCEDVSFGDVAQCRDWRDAKLHTRCGMGPCQGRICGAAAAHYFGWREPALYETGPRRTPLSPVRVSSLMRLDEIEQAGATTAPSIR